MTSSFISVKTERSTTTSVTQDSNDIASSYAATQDSHNQA